MKSTLRLRKTVGKFLTTYGGWTWVEHDRGPGIRPNGFAVSTMRGPLGLEAIVYSRLETWVKDWVLSGRGGEMRFAVLLHHNGSVRTTLTLVPLEVLAELTDAYLTVKRQEALEEMERRAQS